MDSSPRRRLAEHLRRLRLECRLTQEQLAERAHFHPTYIQKVEAARITPSLEAILRLAGALGVPASVVVEGLDEPADDEEDRLVDQVVRLLRGLPAPQIRFVLDFVCFLRERQWHEAHGSGRP